MAAKKYISSFMICLIFLIFVRSIYGEGDCDQYSGMVGTTDRHINGKGFIFNKYKGNSEYARKEICGNLKHFDIIMEGAPKECDKSVEKAENLQFCISTFINDNKNTGCEIYSFEDE